MKTANNQSSADGRGGIVAFRASARLMADAEAAAAAEGLSRSDIARRALIRDLASFASVTSAPSAE